MDAILQTTFAMQLLDWKFCILIQILLCVPKGLIDNKSASVQLMAWRQTDDKPSSEPTLTQSTDAYMRH